MRKRGLSQEDMNYIDFIAKKESGYNLNPNGPSGTHKDGRKFTAYGMFQFLNTTLAGMKHNTPEAYLQNIDTQLDTMIEYMDAGKKIANKYLPHAQEKGYGLYELLSGIHAGGEGGIRRFIMDGKDTGDVVFSNVSVQSSMDAAKKALGRI